MYPPFTPLDSLECLTPEKMRQKRMSWFHPSHRMTQSEANDLLQTMCPDDEMYQECCSIMAGHVADGFSWREAFGKILMTVHAKLNAKRLEAIVKGRKYVKQN